MVDFSISTKKFDIIIIGSGGAGLSAAISAINNGATNIAVISKVPTGNSHTVAAKGGINAALGNVVEDDWKWHAYDTIKGSDYLADVDAVELLCKNAKEAIIDLERMGVVFSRDENGKIAQRAYGGQTISFGGDIARRACYSKDKTGQTILHSLHEQCLKKGVKFFNEFFVTDLLIDENSQCHGCVTIDLNNGEIVIFQSSNLILASGGYSQIYQNTTSALICTGDGSALVLQEGLALQDMEFVQFHPTGIHGLGFLITEAARGEGGYLLNSEGKRFMVDYAPKMLELASRDVIAQAMATEIYHGRGCGKDKNFLHLDLRHISCDVLQNKLPGVVELVKNFARLDVKKDLIPVSPSAHYTMGGIPTNLECTVLNVDKEIKGLMAVGEAACVSVHGANRLGCNSLLDLVVFGKIAGKKAALNKMPSNFDISALVANKISRLKELFLSENTDFTGYYALKSLKTQLQANNEKNLGVFRDENLLQEGLGITYNLYKNFQSYRIKNKSLIWNDELVAYFELRNLFLNSLAANFSALNRCETRGAHYRSDFLERNDKIFFAHSLVKFSDIKQDKLEFLLQPVRTASEIPELNLELKSRSY